MNNKELKLDLDVIISYVLRRLICDLPTNVLKNKKGKAAFSNNFLLKESFVNEDFYHFKQGRFILEEIELNKSKEKVKLEEIIIEHVMPQKLTPKWQVDLERKYKDIHETKINKIGNLTFTGYKLELSNKSFCEKKEF